MNQSQTPQSNPQTNNNRNRPDIRDDMDSREGQETGIDGKNETHRKEDTHPQGKKAGEKKEDDKER